MTEQQTSAIAHVRLPKYPFAEFERHWSQQWETSQLYRVDLQKAARPYYNLLMFPYPSAEGLHVGNVYSYVGADVHGRWMAMQGYDVFEPMGFDAFGMHSENFAIKRGIHPRELTAHNIANFRVQLRSIGNRFDWSHELDTTTPAYYRWTQWIFVQLFKAGLAEQKTAPVNWCPKDKTVLADEQVIDGHCERCDTIVERRWLKQWFLKLTHYAQAMLDGLDKIDWSERVKTLQRNWIGRSDGLEFEMEIVDRPGEHIKVYTTRPDTIFGMTFVSLAPHHPLLEHITAPEQRPEIAAYQSAIRRSSEREKEVSGAFTGAYARHPLTGERMPIWIANYVLAEHGSGAIMGVPAHDETDLQFARMAQLPVRFVVQPAEGNASADEAYIRPGVLCDSGEFTGMTSEQARDAISEDFERSGRGQRVAKYRVRDWLISRQRYWGPPIPIIHCPEHGAVPVPEEQLPVLLPDIEDWMPTGTGESPLAAIESFVNTSCPVCGGPARRETDVSDNFLDSAWYYLRYPSSDDETQPWNMEMTRKWLPVDMCVGGAEHSVLHLMYVRFIAMALHDGGHLPFSEPFKHLRANGTITRSGVKISKSRGNVANPDEYIQRFGADAFRLHLLFMGPFEENSDFTESGIGGTVRFLDRIWQLVERNGTATAVTPDQAARRVLHSLIKRVTSDIKDFKYHTAIAAMMAYLNGLEAAVSREEVSSLLLLLAPLAPFICEELWQHIGGEGSIHRASWPSFDPDLAREETKTILVQVDSRIRDRFSLSPEMSDEEVKRLAMASEKVQPYLATRSIQRIVYVPGKLINIVTGDSA